MCTWRRYTALSAVPQVVLSSPIGCSQSTLDLTTRARMGRIFDIVCFILAKENIAFAKYSSLLELEKRHDVNLGHAYTMADSANLFTSFITKPNDRSSSTPSIALELVSLVC